MKENKVYLYLGVLLFLDALLIFSLNNILNIETYKIETFGHKSINEYLKNMEFFFNTFGLKSVFLFFHFCNALLLFYFSKNFLKRPR
ncbi:MAG: hypothetical protein K2I71_01875, partial [Helicobacter sp.]|nr:hypothetical protein [Helicobacter sp.]